MSTQNSFYQSDVGRRSLKNFKTSYKDGNISFIYRPYGRDESTMIEIREDGLYATFSPGVRKISGKFVPISERGKPKQIRMNLLTNGKNKVPDNYIGSGTLAKPKQIRMNLLTNGKNKVPNDYTGPGSNILSNNLKLVEISGSKEITRDLISACTNMVQDVSQIMRKGDKEFVMTGNYSDDVTKFLNEVGFNLISPEKYQLREAREEFYKLLKLKLGLETSKQI
ncbi:MAG: hypothetical protein KAS04_04985 [Candidatus Aenigmarchaeota archaeon]|nr:hypothetical protein [Candidatus Aenigmarchaeota archaeon]